MKVARDRLGAKPKLTAVKAMRKHAIDVATRLQELGVDPITILALFAAGDVVSLGLMTEEEFDAEAEVVMVKGCSVIMKESGASRAARVLEPRERRAAASELASYVWPKRQAVTVSNPDGSNIQGGAPQIIVTMPDNGRGAKR